MPMRICGKSALLTASAPAVPAERKIGHMVGSVNDRVVTFRDARLGAEMRGKGLIGVVGVPFKVKIGTW
jgi:hypothetical protein